MDLGVDPAECHDRRERVEDGHAFFSLGEQCRAQKAAVAWPLGKLDVIGFGMAADEPPSPGTPLLNRDFTPTLTRTDSIPVAMMARSPARVSRDGREGSARDRARARAARIAERGRGVEMRSAIGLPRKGAKTFSTRVSSALTSERIKPTGTSVRQLWARAPTASGSDDRGCRHGGVAQRRGGQRGDTPKEGQNSGSAEAAQV